MKAQTVLRIRCRSREAAEDLALRLQADGYRAGRRSRTVTARTESSEAARRLASKLELEPGTALVRDAHRRLPFRPASRSALVTGASTALRP
jgi:hypothetical protein